MTVRETDPALRRFERDGVLACGVMACVAAVVSGWRWDVAAGVIAGGALTAFSYLTIKGGIDALARSPAIARAAPAESRRREAPVPPETAEEGVREAPARRPGNILRAIVTVVKYFTRFALLAVGAYVMLTCFHLHPAGLLVGALTPFVAALGQLVRMSRAPSGGNRLL